MSETLSVRALLDAKPTEEDYQKFAKAVVAGAIKKFTAHMFKLYKGTPDKYSLIQIQISAGDIEGDVSWSDLVEMRAILQLDQEKLNSYIASEVVKSFPLGDDVNVLAQSITKTREMDFMTNELKEEEVVDDLTGASDIADGDLNFNLVFIDNVNTESFKKGTDESVTYVFVEQSIDNSL